MNTTRCYYNVACWKGILKKKKIDIPCESFCIFLFYLEKWKKSGKKKRNHKRSNQKETEQNTQKEEKPPLPTGLKCSEETHGYTKLAGVVRTHSG